MEWLGELLAETDITFGIALLRLFLAFLVGGVIGVERESHKQQAGLRTHMLITIGAALLAMLSIHIPRAYFNPDAGDPGRIAAQVVSGIGFLGAGAILRLGANVRGLTTAASLWTVAAIGLAIGGGLYVPAMIAAVLVFFTLVVLNVFERRIFPKQYLKMLRIFSRTGSADVRPMESILRRFRIEVKSTDLEQITDKGITRASFLCYIPDNAPLNDLYDELKQLPGVYKITLVQHI